MTAEITDILKLSKTESETILHADIKRVIVKHAAQQDMTKSDLVGVLEMVKFDVLFDMDNNSE